MWEESMTCNNDPQLELTRLVVMLHVQQSYSSQGLQTAFFDGAPEIGIIIARGREVVGIIHVDPVTLCVSLLLGWPTKLWDSHSKSRPLLRTKLTIFTSLLLLEYFIHHIRVFYGFTQLFHKPQGKSTIDKRDFLKPRAAKLQVLTVALQVSHISASTPKLCHHFPEAASCGQS